MDRDLKWVELIAWQYPTATSVPARTSVILNLRTGPTQIYIIETRKSNTSSVMLNRRDKLKKLFFGSMAAIITCVYLRFWFTSAIRGKEDAKDAHLIHSISTLPLMKQKFNIIRYSDIVSWNRHQSSSFEATSVLSDDTRIYFHETTGRDHLNLRQLCAVESTAKENSNRSIQVFFQSNHVNLTIGPLASILEKYPNIYVILINVRDYFNQTPLEGWYLRGAWRQSPYKTEHFSDYIRILSSYKGGGMYMDLDFVALKPFDDNIFWNFVPEEDDSVLTGSSFHFQKDHPIVRKMMTYLASSYHPKKWSYSGPAMFQSVLLKYCHRRAPLPTYPVFLCPDIRVLPKTYLYPYKFAQWKRMFLSNVNGDDAIFQSYAVHTYNKLSKREPVYVGSNQLYSHIARVHCPLTYAHALSNLEVDYF